jgi:hypothetical protein
MKTKNYVNLNQYILEGFARLLDLGSTQTMNDDRSTSLDDDIYSIIQESWEEVGENIREAMNQYGQERKG